MRKIGNFFKHNWIRLVVAISIGIIFAIIYISVNGKWTLIRSYSDALMVGGGIVFFFGLLVFVGTQGTFNIFSFYPNRRKKEDGSKENFAEYTVRKEQERKQYTWTFVPYVLVGLLYLGIGLLLLLFVK